MKIHEEKHCENWLQSVVTSGSFRRYLVIAARSGQRLLTEPTTGAQVGRRELVILPNAAIGVRETSGSA